MSSLKNDETGRVVLLPDDDAQAYDALVSRLLQKFSPVGGEESALVQSIADSEWRLARIPALEAGIYAVGRLEFASLYVSEENEAARRHLLEAKVFLAYQRPLNNLSVQEGRLRRQRARDIAALRELQQARNHHAAPLGFEFSNSQSEQSEPGVESAANTASHSQTGPQNASVPPAVGLSSRTAQANIVSSASQRNARPHLLAANSGTSQGTGCGHRS